MTITLLFDLDDTLLGNDMDQFLPVYLQALSAHLAQYTEPRQMIKTLMAASAQMLENLLPDRTLEEVFDAGFYPPLGLKKEQMRPILNTFYAEEFPRLRKLSQFKPEALELVKAVLRRGYRVAIATNPLFPETAIRQRLSWAGLPPEDFPFSLIPSYHTFHFAKPNPVYFAELMAKLAWPEGPVVMVGDSPSNDIAPARQAGLATYWITHQDTENQPPSTGHGTLVDFLPWLDAADPDSLLPDFSSPSGSLATLRATPALFYSLCSDLTSEALAVRPAPGEWSAVEILCHLTDMDADVNLPRFRKVIQETNPFVAGIETDSWAETRQYIQRDGPQSLQNFVATRLELLAFLETLSSEEWHRPARHAVFGPTHLQEMVNFAAGHDRLHIRQIFQTIPTYEPI